MMKTKITNEAGYMIDYDMLRAGIDQKVLALGIKEDDALRIIEEPLGKAARPTIFAYRLWSTVSLLGLGYCCYLAVTEAWWWIVVGWASWLVIRKSNRKSVSQNLTTAGVADEELYNRIMEKNLWFYETSDRELFKEYKR